jgi:hypothetical protein
VKTTGSHQQLIAISEEEKLNFKTSIFSSIAAIFQAENLGNCRKQENKIMINCYFPYKNVFQFTTTYS